MGPDQIIPIIQALGIGIAWMSQLQV